MSREIGGEVGIHETATVKGSYKTEFELPHSLKICEGKIIPMKEKGIVNKEKWYMHIHQDSNGNTKTTSICLDKENQNDRT